MGVSKNELATMPEADARRYRLNQFVSSMNAWLPVGAWQQLPHGKPLNPKVFAVDRTLVGTMQALFVPH